MITQQLRAIRRCGAWARGRCTARGGALVVVSVLLVACAGQSAPSTPAAAVRIESGVTALTPPASSLNNSADAAVGSAAGTANDGAAQAPDVTPPPAAFDLFEVGAEVQARGLLRIYAAAEPTAPTLAEYAQGARFTVLGPPGDVTTYPVELSGVRWYRVRAADALVGWVIADGIEAPAELE